MTDPILRCRALGKRFGGFAAVSDVELEVQRGTIHALIGPNGAGKTTCFNMITKFLSPSTGQILFDGRDITGLSPAPVARLGLVRSFQISATFSNLTLIENLRLALMRATDAPWRFWRSGRSLRAHDARALELLAMVGLADMADLPAQELSYGRKRALEIVTTLALRPRLMLLDEPTSGMGHEDIGPVINLIREAARDTTILMVEHNLHVVSELADTVSVLARGQIIAEGSYHQISAHPEVIAAYLGRQANSTAVKGGVDA